MRVTNYEINTNNKNELLTICVSDIHYYHKKDEKKLKNIINAVYKYHPDALFIVGDLIDCSDVLNKNENCMILENFFIKLNKLTNVYLCFGNHDISSYQNKNWQIDSNILKEKLLNKLDNLKNIHYKDYVVYTLNSYKICLINPSLNYAMTNLELSEQVLLEEKEHYKILNELKSTDYNIILCHYPNAIKSLVTYNKLKYGNLCISGHNHNGCTQLRIFPLENILNKLNKNNVGIITPSKSFKRCDNQMDRGLIKLNNKTTLIINPAITTLSHKTKILRYFNNLFYEGITIIKYKK